MECPVVGVSLAVVGLCWILGSLLVPREGWGNLSMGSSERVQVSVLVILLTISHFTQKSDQELGGVVGVGQPEIRRQGGVASLISLWSVRYCRFLLSLEVF